MQTLVLIQIFIDLLIKRKITRTALSKKYELSIRTISRYVDVLAKAGIPIESRTGENGGYCLPDDYRIERHGFSQTQWGRIRDAVSKTAAEFGDDVNYGILELIEKSDK